ncbi:MAG: 3-phosphoshikimate 1-carboxyvinyltransferase [Tunicatimonas sp.]
MSTQKIRLHPPTDHIEAEVQLAASKSESNRALVIQALSDEEITLHNLSEARDTQTMQRLLQSAEPEWDVLDAGTTMRFLIAYSAVARMGKLLKGTARMHQRPVKLLVDALRGLGADIAYLENEGYPPVLVRGFTNGQTARRVSIRGDVSSQYISALLMIAPTLADGLELSLTGKVGSRPYIEMTLGLMGHFGIKHHWNEDNLIRIDPQPYRAGTYTIESDWSGASYWYSLVALADNARVKLLGLRQPSWQGDSAIVGIMDQLGVATAFEEDGVKLTKKASAETLTQDFSDCPDLAQTVAVVCAAKQIPATLNGLESLRIKETDRVAALQNELAKIGATLEEENGRGKIMPSNDGYSGKELEFNTYEDHRMAMAFAPLATKATVTIEEPEVVNKSYPRFWEDLATAGIATELLG